MKLTKNFSLSEFECKGGCKIPNDVFENIKLLATHLQAFRDVFNEPITINSSYRCVEYNSLVGGSKTSQHLLGKAADITIKGYTPDEVADKIELLHSENRNRTNGLGRYNTFTHVDIRNNYARWDNRI
tara:strand:+ start:159 stop:542 length:384 start_codon:yes stop_codon:yes gene_type:complete